MKEENPQNEVDGENRISVYCGNAEGVGNYGFRSIFHVEDSMPVTSPEVVFQMPGEDVVLIAISRMVYGG